MIRVVLLIRGGGVPQRGSIAQQSLGRAPLPRYLPLAVGIGVVVGLVALLSTSGNWRAAVITLILGILALSYVVVRGYAGQVSLAQLTLAGGSAFLLARLATDLHIPFPSRRCMVR